MHNRAQRAGKFVDHAHPEVLVAVKASTWPVESVS